MTISFIYTAAITLAIICFSRGVKNAFFGLFALLATLEVNRITSSAALIASQEIGCSDIVLAVLFICSVILLIQKVRINESLLAIGMIVFTLATISLIVNLLFPYEGLIVTSNGSWDGLLFGTSSPQHVEIGIRTLLVLTRLTIYIVVIWCAASVLTRNDYLKAASYVLVFGKVHIAFGVFELLTKSVLGSSVAIDISSTLFPSFSSAVTDIVVRGEITSLQGFTREPSHFAMALSVSLVILVLLNCAGRGRRFDAFWCFAALLLLALSGAFTAIVGIAIVVIVAFRYRRILFARIDKRIGLVIYIVFFALILLSLFVLTGGIRIGNIYYVDKMANVAENIDAIIGRRYGNISGSYDALPRIVSMVECMRVFFKRPLFGIGPGVVNPFSGISAILSQYGALFTVAWFLFLVAYGRSLCGRSGSRLFGLYVFLNGLLLYGGGYEYTFTWILLGGLFVIKEPSINLETLEVVNVPDASRCWPRKTCNTHSL